MLNNAANWTSGVFKSAASDLKAAELFYKANPAVLAGFAAAAIALPFIESNDERGPGETALITTPAVAAAFTSAPSITEVFNRTKKTAGAMFRNRSVIDKIFRNNDIYALQSILADMPAEHRAAFSKLEATTKIGFYQSKVATSAEKAASLADKTSKAAKVVQSRMESVSEWASDDPRWKTMAASFRESALNAQTMNDAYTETLRQPLPEGAAAKQWVEETLAKFMPEGKEPDGRFVRSLASRFRQESKGLTGKDGKFSPIGTDAMRLEKPVNAREVKPWAVTTDREKVLQIIREYDGGQRSKLADILEERASAHNAQGFNDFKLHYDPETMRPVGMEMLNSDKKLNLSFGIADLKTGQVNTGKDFSTSGVASRIVQANKNWSMTDYLGDEFAAQFSHLDREKLLTDVRGAQGWERPFGQNATQARAGLHDPRQTYLYSRSGVLANSDIHLDGKGKKQLTYEEDIAITKARIERGERSFGGTGAGSKGRMSLNGPDMDASFRFDKPGSMDLTQTKRWNLMEDLPAELKPHVLTADMEELAEKFSGQNLFEMTVGSQHVGAFDYFGTAASIADRGGLPLSEKGWKKLFSKELGEKPDFKDPKVMKSLNEFSLKKTAEVMSGSAFTSEADKAWYQEQRSSMKTFFENGIRDAADATSEETLFADISREAAGKRSLLGTFNQMGTAGGEGHFAVFGDRIDVPVFAQKRHELKETVQGLDQYMATENGVLKPNWRELQLPGNFHLGIKNDLSLDPAPIGNGQKHIITDMFAEGEGEARRYVVTTAQVENISNPGMKTSFGGRKMVAVKMDSSRAISMLEKFNAAVGNKETDLTGNIHGLIRSDEMQKVSVGMEDMVGLAEQLVNAQADVADSPGLKIAREQLDAGLQSFSVRRSKSGALVIDTKELAKSTGNLDGYMKRQQELKTLLFGKTSRIDYNNLEELAKSESLVAEHGLLGQMEVHMVANARANEHTLQHSPVLKKYLNHMDAYQSRPENRGNRFVDYLSENARRVRGGAMEHELEKRQRSVYPTEDLFRLMEENGMHRQVRDINGRLKANGAGDPRQTAKALDWTRKGLDNPTKGSKVIELGEDALKIQGSRGDQLTGTILDWRRPDLKDNFFYKLSEPVDVRYGEEVRTKTHIAHPGYEGFGGAPNLHDARTKAMPTEVGKAWERLVHADSVVKNTGTGKEALAKAVKDYEDNLNTIMAGKGKMLRAYMFDPQAFGGTPAKVVTAESETFDLFLSPANWQKERSRLPKHIQELADQSGSFFATHARHPQNFAGYVRVRAKEGLTDYQVGMGDAYRELVHGDFDLDPSEVFKVTETDTWKEAESVLNNPESRQWRMARESNLFRSHEQNINVTQKILDQNAKSVGERALKKYVYEQQMQAAQARAAGKYIGRASHMATRVQLAAESIPGVLSAEELQHMVNTREATWNIRQSLIALQKHEGEAINPMNYIDQFQSALSAGDEAGADRFLGLMQEMARLNADEQTTNWTAAHTNRFGDKLKITENGVQRAPKVGDKVNLLAEVLEQDKGTQEAIKNIVRRRGDKAVAQAQNNAFKLLTRDSQAVPGGLYNTFAEVDSAMGHLTTHLAHGGFAAEQSAGRLKQAADLLKTAAKEGHTALAPSKKVLLAGTLVAAAAGLVVAGRPGNIGGARAPKPASSRPEEQIGVTDQVPGVPETGYMSTNPPRNISFRNGPTRAIVAPMRRGTNLDVTMDAPDESAVKQLRHRLQSAGGGETFVNNNNMGGWRDGATRISARERLKDDLARY